MAVKFFGSMICGAVWKGETCEQPPHSDSSHQSIDGKHWPDEWTEYYFTEGANGHWDKTQTRNVLPSVAPHEHPKAVSVTPEHPSEVYILRRALESIANHSPAMSDWPHTTERMQLLAKDALILAGNTK